MASNNRIAADVVLWVFTLVPLGALLGATAAGAITASNVLNIVSTAGTMAAALVALWLGVASIRSQQLANLDRASVFAARILPTLKAAGDALDELERKLTYVLAGEQADWPGVRQHRIHVRREAVEATLGLPTFVLHHNTVVELTGLPNRTAIRVSQAMGDLDRLKEEAKAALPGEYGDLNTNALASGEAAVAAWVSRIATARDHLRYARDRCEVATKGSARSAAIWESVSNA